MKRILLLLAFASTIISCNKKKADDTPIVVPDKFTCSVKDSVVLTHDYEWLDWEMAALKLDRSAYLDTPAQIFINGLVAKSKIAVDTCDISVRRINVDAIDRYWWYLSVVESNGKWLGGNNGGPFSLGLGAGIANLLKTKANKCYRMYIAVLDENNSKVLFKSHFDFVY